MKKVLSVAIILAVLIFSACIPAFAEDTPSYTTPYTFDDSGEGVESDIIYSDRAVDELPPDTIELTDEEKLKLAQDYIAQYGRSDDPENYTVLCFKTLSNGMKLVFVEPNDWEYLTLLAMETIGKYRYCHGYGRSVKLYQNGVYTEFSDAYKSGMIDDAVLDEINDVMHFDRYAEQTATTQPEEPTVEATTVPQTKSATDDGATLDSTYNSGSGENGAIATGDNVSFVIIFAVALAAAVGIGFAALRRKTV